MTTNTDLIKRVVEAIDNVDCIIRILTRTWCLVRILTYIRHGTRQRTYTERWRVYYPHSQRGKENKG